MALKLLYAEFETCFGPSTQGAGTQGAGTKTHLESRCRTILILYNLCSTGHALFTRLRAWLPGHAPFARPRGW